MYLRNTTNKLQETSPPSGLKEIGRIATFSRVGNRCTGSFSSAHQPETDTYQLFLPSFFPALAPLPLLLPAEPRPSKLLVRVYSSTIPERFPRSCFGFLYINISAISPIKAATVQGSRVLQIRRSHSLTAYNTTSLSSPSSLLSARPLSPRQ